MYTGTLDRIQNPTERAEGSATVHGAQIDEALDVFWTNRDKQSVQRNLHMKGFEALIRQELINAGIPDNYIFTGKPYLPGYYRARKQWDLVVSYDGILVAAIEFKSQIGSVSKNINNRFEEALGTATDTAAAQERNEAFGPIAPWMGYVFILQEDEETTKKDRDTSAKFEVDPTYVGMSYEDRYQEMIRRFLLHKVYDAGWFLTTTYIDGVRTHKEPLSIASFAVFAAALNGRVQQVQAFLEDRREKQTQSDEPSTGRTPELF
ncbi:PaeR7I family type II restriction endonuclease [Nonomuraea sp. NPDC023979]|uniref:PaeR7I family type II restriction endonuclease n=1 Tax=Nonomuraea sp. NPDC023979 TaxID=3154796 RepID=UPI0033D9F29D